MWFEKGLDNPVSDYADVQQLAVQRAKDGDIFVEVGSFVGESTAYLIDLVKASGKKLDLYSVDLFDIVEMVKDGKHEMSLVMNDKGLTPTKWLEQHGPRCMLSDFYANLSYKGRDAYLTAALVGRSAKMAERFADKSVAFVYVDAGHSFDNVLADITAWYPKVKDDGIGMAGHDWYSSDEVKRAVIAFAQANELNIALTSSSWILTR